MNTRRESAMLAIIALFAMALACEIAWEVFQ